MPIYHFFPGENMYCSSCGLNFKSQEDYRNHFKDGRCEKYYFKRKINQSKKRFKRKLQKV